MSARTLVSKSEYARHRGVTPAAVTYWARDGRIVLLDGKVDRDASDAALDKTLSPIHGGKRTTAERAPEPETVGSRADLIRQKSRQSELSADLLALELRKKKGEVIDRAGHDRALLEALGPILARLDSIGSRAAPKALGQNDLRVVQDAIDDEVTVVRQEIADTLRAMAAAEAATKQ